MTCGVESVKERKLIMLEQRQVSECLRQVLRHSVALLWVELLTENGAGLKSAQNTFNLKWRWLPIALELYFLVNSLDIH